MRKRVLDLCSGADGAATKAFADAGWERVRVEWDTKCEAEIHADLLTLGPDDLAGPWDFIWASPPCEKFSIAGRGAPWEPHGPDARFGFSPRTVDAIDATRLALHCQYLIYVLEPRAAIMENPSGMMKKILPMKPQKLIWYCQYEDSRAKPTDLWLFGAAQEFFFKPPCRNKRNGETDFCHHEEAPRGAKTGTQGAGSYHDRSIVPYGLSRAVWEQMEQLLAGTLPTGTLFDALR